MPKPATGAGHEHLGGVREAGISQIQHPSRRPVLQDHVSCHGDACARALANGEPHPGFIAMRTSRRTSSRIARYDAPAAPDRPLRRPAVHSPGVIGSGLFLRPADNVLTKETGKYRHGPQADRIARDHPPLLHVRRSYKRAGTGQPPDRVAIITTIAASLSCDSDVRLRYRRSTHFLRKGEIVTPHPHHPNVHCRKQDHPAAPPRACRGRAPRNALNGWSSGARPLEAGGS
jgi:hypothetical protein